MSHLSTLGAVGQGHGPEGKAWKKSMRGMDQRCVCCCRWTLKVALLFRSSVWSHWRGKDSPLQPDGQLAWPRGGCRALGAVTAD